MSVLQTGGSFNTEALWQHSVGTAVAAANLAKRSQLSEAQAFTAGLLHDLGKLVLASMERGVYAELILSSAAAGNRLVEGEKVSFGFDHADLGARLLEQWNFPEEVVQAVRHHHASTDTEEANQPLAAIVRLANGLAHQVLDRNEASPENYAPSAGTLQRLGLTNADIPGLLDETRDALEQVEALLQMRA